MADTFSNDLRLRLQESGSNAGTWGDLLNGTITNIASALGQGSEAIPNASTHTITLADGTADEARSLYLKCTGGGQACTVTLGPNTISKVWIIDNATSYTLTFSQGSGANVSIAAGAVKVIATDGAGSGAAVVDTLDGLEGSLSTLAVTGAITANGGIDVDNINIDGTTIALSSGDLTLDSAGDITLDFDGGDLRLKDGGTEIGLITSDGSNLGIFSRVSDKDIIFYGNDGGSTITALTLDMSAAGAATFNSKVTSSGFIASSLLNSANNSLTMVGGGSATNNGANLTLYGGSASSSAGDFRFRNGTAVTATITAAGAATIANGLTLTDGNLVVANGHGIDFSATGNIPGTSSELLDSYEEGTFTPTAVTGFGGFNTLQTARYTKIGDIVHIQLYATGLSSQSANLLNMGGLPFTCKSNGWSPGSMNYTGTTMSNPHARARGGEARVDFKKNDDQAILGTDITGHLIFQLTYQTDA